MLFVLCHALSQQASCVLVAGSNFVLAAVHRSMTEAPSLYILMLA